MSSEVELTYEMYPGFCEPDEHWPIHGPGYVYSVDIEIETLSAFNMISFESKLVKVWVEEDDEEGGVDLNNLQDYELTFEFANGVTMSGRLCKHVIEFSEVGLTEDQWIKWGEDREIVPLVKGVDYDRGHEEAV